MKITENQIHEISQDLQTGLKTFVPDLFRVAVEDLEGIEHD